MTDIPTETIYITNQLETMSSFGVIADSLEQVYIPASVSKAAEVKVGGTYEAAVIPNNHPQSGATPWMAVRVTQAGEDVSAVVAQEDDFADVTEALSEYDCPIEAQHLTISPGRIEKAWRKGKIVRVEAKQSPYAEPVILWAHSMEVV